ncbi:MAG: hypothetical protein AAGD86_09660, partial [Pseudomonadota bacterium]
LEVDAGLDAAREALGQLLLERDRAAEAVDVLSAAPGAPHGLSAAALLSLGTAYGELGRTDDARSTLTAGRAAAKASGADSVVRLRIDAALRALEAGR